MDAEAGTLPAPEIAPGASASPSVPEELHGHPVRVDTHAHASHEPTNGKVGMWIFLLTDALSFGGLLIGYASLRAWSPTWPVPSKVLNIPLTAFNTFLLICSSVSMVLAVSAAESGDRKRVIKWLGATVLGGAGFLGIQAYEYHHLLGEGLSLSSSLFGATFFTLTGFHGCHVFSGVVYLSSLLIGVLAGKFTSPGDTHVEIAGLFWHFVDLVWILIFTFVYLV